MLEQEGDISAWEYAYNNPIPERYPCPEAGANVHTSLIDTGEKLALYNLNSIDYGQWKAGKSCSNAAKTDLLN